MDGQLELVREVVMDFEQRNIVFRDEELPTSEEHSCPLMISVDVNNFPLPGVLIDTSASKNVCSLSTLDHLGIVENKVTKHRFACAAYDKSLREAVGTIQLNITIGPVTSTTMVIEMEEELVEPLILGRSWMAEIGVVASPVHQLLKFKH